MLVRLSNMRGLDLRLFDFDHDATWMALFLNADGQVYGRYGGGPPDKLGKERSLKGLDHALRQALLLHQRGIPSQPSAGPPYRVEDFPAARRFAPNACFHCHHVSEFRRELKQSQGTWTLDQVWVYPEPANLGFTTHPDQGDRVVHVKPGSPVHKAGLRPGDVLQAIAGLPLASLADIRHALHLTPAVGKVQFKWQRGPRVFEAQVTLPAGWRKTDVSWRHSLKSFGPDPCVQGEDLTPAEKQTLGLAPAALAFRQGPFLQAAARQAGIQINDIILGIDGQDLRMTARQFLTHVRLTCKSADTLPLVVLRGKERLVVRLRLP